MIPIERGVYPCIHHITENSRNFINFSANSECEKEQIEYSYFALEKVFGARKASFIKRLNYWLDKCGRDINGLSGKWIYNPTHEWAEQLNCSESTVKRLIKSLEEQGIVLSKKVNARKYNQTKWYSLDYKILQSILKLEKTDTKASEKKWTNRLGQNEPIIVSNSRNNYTNTSSNELKNKYLYSEEEIKFSKHTKESKALQTELTENETELVEQMVELWNKVFSYSLSPIKAYVSKNNRKTLLNVLNNHFAGDLSEWQEYAKKVNSSQFLMGEKATKKNFKAIFSWLIEESTIESIKSGGYGVGDRKLDMENIEENREKQKKEVIHQAEKMFEKQIKQTGKDKEFEEYIKREQWQEDGDKYGIGRYFGAYMSPNQILHDEKYQGHYQMCLKQYMAKKYQGMSMTDIRKICMDRLQRKENIDMQMLIQGKRER